MIVLGVLAILRAPEAELAWSGISCSNIGCYEGDYLIGICVESFEKGDFAGPLQRPNDMV
jgi:hypothetical protein